MPKKSLFGLTLLVFCTSHFALSTLAPLSPEQRTNNASDIVTGYVASIKKEIVDDNAVYTVGMIVNDIEKGSHQSGSYIRFHYWRALSQSLNSCEDSGQQDTIKHYEAIRVYLNYDVQTHSLHLLWPNGFDRISL